MFNLVYVALFWREKFKGYLIKIVVEEVVRVNAVQFSSSFPAKSLSIYRAHFWMTPL